MSDTFKVVLSLDQKLITNDEIDQIMQLCNSYNLTCIVKPRRIVVSGQEQSVKADRIRRQAA